MSEGQLTEEQFEHAVREIEENGYTILEDMIPHEHRVRLHARASELIEEEGARTAHLPGTETWRWQHRLRSLVSLDPMFREAAMFGPIARVMEKLLGPGYILFASAVNEVGPGAIPMRLHVDDLLLRLPRPFPKPLLLNSLWALTEFTEENGGTRLIPRSHLEVPDLNDSRTIQPPMKPGSILIYQGSVVHAASRNTTESNWRCAMIFTYCAGFIRPVESPLKTIPIAELRQMRPELRQLLSYDYWSDPTLPRLY
jgi:ectoine hydroxylase-related dioxygenase (phytanoyl-CoA dioxygenase family)